MTHHIQSCELRFQWDDHPFPLHQQPHYLHIINESRYKHANQEAHCRLYSVHSSNKASLIEFVLAYTTVRRSKNVAINILMGRIAQTKNECEMPTNLEDRVVFC